MGLIIFFDRDIRYCLESADIVAVRGNPKCTLKSFGSGSLNCEPGGATVDQEDEDEG